MRSLFKIIETYLENPQDKDMERVLNRESDKRNVLKMYEKIQDLERQLAEARELEKKAFWSALNITDEDFNSRDTGGNCFDEVKQIFWDEYQEQLKEKG